MLGMTNSLSENLERPLQSTSGYARERVRPVLGALFFGIIMTKRKKVPRASIAVTILHDVDYVALMQRRGGPAAFGIFVAMIVAAKTQKNHGRYTNWTRTLPQLVSSTTRTLHAAINLISEVCKENGNPPWIGVDGNSIYIRNYDEWNESWGGERPGAGRPSVKSSGIQDEFNGNQSYSDSDSSPSYEGEKTPPQGFVGIEEIVESNISEFYKNLPMLEAEKSKTESLRKTIRLWIKEDRLRAAEKGDASINLKIWMAFANAATSAMNACKNQGFASRDAWDAIAKLDASRFGRG